MKIAYRAVFVTLCFCFLAGAALPTGTIAGSIQDSSGAVVPGARVIATALATGLTRETRSGSNGEYVIPLLPVGAYRLTVEMTGFQGFEQVGIVVTADQNSTVPITLKVGSSTQSVTVQANAQMLETRSGALSQVITQQSIVQLPLNGRNPAALVLLAPGTLDMNAGNARGGSGALQSVAYPGEQVISSGGARFDGINYYLDGGYNEDIYDNLNNPFPNPDAVQEFSVTTNSYSAQFGYASGAIVNIVTKSGTNQFHGGVFDYIRNRDFNARNYFATQRDQLERNQFGGDLGGPIKKDKLFFFGNYQGTVSHDITEANPATVPTAAERTGDFSALKTHLVDPYTRVPYPNNQIPLSQFTSASTTILQLIPLPGTSNGLTYYSLPQFYTENQFLARVDYNFSKHHVFARYFYTHYVLSPVDTSVNLLRLNSGSDFPNQQVTAGDTYTIGPNMFNSFIFAYTRDNNTIKAAASPLTWSGLGIPVAKSAIGLQAFPLSISGWFGLNGGHFTNNNRHTFDINDSLNWITGKHEIALGGEFVRLSDAESNTNLQDPSFTFSTTSFTGNPISDFMIGAVDEFQQGGGEYFNRSGNQPAVFIEDKYHLNRSLILTLGLRWSPFLPYGDSQGRTECFVPGLQSQRFPNSPNGYLFEGDPGCPTGGFNSSWETLGPRFGFAYNRGGVSKTTIRGGWGMFYSRPYMNMYTRMADSAPFSPQYVLFDVPFMDPYQGMSNPFPAQFAPFVPPSSSTFALPLGEAQAFQANWKPGEVTNWNLTVERQLTTNILVRVGYVGSIARHLSYVTDTNAPLPSPTATKANEQSRRPYQQFEEIAYNASVINSNYNALEATVDKRLSKGMTLTANYTWSKSIDPISVTGGFAAISNVCNVYNINKCRGVSDFNVPQNFILNYWWEIPSVQHGLAKALFGGWSTTAIWTWLRGYPLNITSGGDYSYSLPEVANDQAQQISPWHYTSGSHAQRIAQWFTTNSFTHPAPNSFGNVSRNTLVGPGTFNIDIAIHRQFSLTDRFKLQYRAEFFNFLNNTQLNNPGTTLNAETFGQITAARDPRIMQMALKLSF